MVAVDTAHTKARCAADTRGLPAMRAESRAVSATIPVAKRARMNAPATRPNAITNGVTNSRLGKRPFSVCQL